MSFARLVTIITQDENARNSILKSGIDLTREQLDTFESCDQFWDTEIAAIFNDNSLRYTLDLRECVPLDEYSESIDMCFIGGVQRDGMYLKYK